MLKYFIYLNKRAVKANFVAFLLLLGRHCPQILVFILKIAHRICFFHPFVCQRKLASRPQKMPTERHLPH